MKNGFVCPFFTPCFVPVRSNNLYSFMFQFVQTKTGAMYLQRSCFVSYLTMIFLPSTMLMPGCRLLMR